MTTLADLAGVVAVATTDGDPRTEVDSIEHDSRRVGPGDLFCCLSGATTDGHDHAAGALARGARALVVGRPLCLGVPELRVPDCRAALGPLSATVWGHPSGQLVTIGVTGTSGKTTVTHLLGQVLDCLGLDCSVIGTLTGTRTTPEPPELQARLAAHRRTGGRAAAVEVSSHGLTHRRVDGTRFRVVVLTSLTRDHLDHHGSAAAYVAAKARLLTPTFAPVAVVCVDGTAARRVAAECPIVVRPYRLDDAHIVDRGAHRTVFDHAGRRFDVPLIGDHNIRNTLAVIETADELGLDPAALAAALATVELPEGRFQRIERGQPFRVVVDYAHTPDALALVLRALRPHTTGELVVVFGCGGDRDTTKRALMGRAAERLADCVVVTADNPRTEPLDHIITDILAGTSRPNGVHVELDRASALASVLGGRRPGDSVLLAGKGHERTQQLRSGPRPHHDPHVAADALAHLGWTDNLPAPCA